MRSPGGTETGQRVERSCQINVATERLNKLRAPEEKSIEVHADLAGVIATASLSPSQVTRIRGVRQALVKAMRGPWQKALKELSMLPRRVHRRTWRRLQRISIRGSSGGETSARSCCCDTRGRVSSVTRPNRFL